MKAYYVLSIVAAGVISTVVGTNLVAAAGTRADAQAEVVTVPSESLERLKAQSDSGTTLTWRRPL